MAGYSIEISRTTEQQLWKLEIQDRRRAVRAVVALEGDPHPLWSRKLSGYGDVFRIRIGVFRVLYSVEDRKLIVIILKIGHRKDVYR